MQRTPCYTFVAVAVTDWNWHYPVELQDYAWDCAAASTAWALSAAGIPYSEREVIAGLGPERISPTYGLHDATGAGIVDWLATIGVTAEYDELVSWTEITDAAGYQPMIAGGRAWYHWTGIRMAGPAGGDADFPYVLLANPSPGWMGITQWMNIGDWEVLGPFSAVWFTKW